MGVGVQLHARADLPTGKRPDTHFIGGWVGPRARLDGCEKCDLQFGRLTMLKCCVNYMKRYFVISPKLLVPLVYLF